VLQSIYDKTSIQCPFESDTTSGKDTVFDIDDLFRLRELAFAAEISLAKARKVDSEFRIKNKEELLHVLTDKEIFSKILEQGAEAREVNNNIKSYLRKNQTYLEKTINNRSSLFLFSKQI
jgi:hypothetical protein